MGIIREFITPVQEVFDYVCYRIELFFRRNNLYRGTGKSRRPINHRTDFGIGVVWVTIHLWLNLLTLIQILAPELLKSYGRHKYNIWWWFFIIIAIILLFALFNYWSGERFSKIKQKYRIDPHATLKGWMIVLYFAATWALFIISLSDI